MKEFVMPRWCLVDEYGRPEERKYYTVVLLHPDESGDRIVAEYGVRRYDYVENVAGAHKMCNQIDEDGPAWLSHEDDNEDEIVYAWLSEDPWWPPELELPKGVEFVHG